MKLLKKVAGVGGVSVTQHITIAKTANPRSAKQMAWSDWSKNR